MSDRAAHTSALSFAVQSVGPAAASAPSVYSNSNLPLSSHSHSVPLTIVSGGSSVRLAPSTPSSSSSSSYSMPRPQQSRSSWLQANSGMESSSSSSSSFNASGSGAALHRVTQHAPSAHSSTLGRLIGDAVELQRPRTPPSGVPAPTAPSNPNEDTQYQDAVFQMSVVASEYLKLVNAPVSAAARASGVPAAAAAPIPTATLGSGVELFLLEQSRMKHQQRLWEAEVLAALAPAQQIELQSLIQRLGLAVQAGKMDDVLAFQTDLASTSTPAPLARALYSNNAVFDAWVDCLFAAKQFRAATSLIHQRLSSGLSTQDYSLSRKTMCKLLTACAVEGNVSASLMVLRESSWGALALPGAASENTDASKFVPTSVSRLPSWVPQYYMSQAAMTSLTQPRVEAEVDDAAVDGLLAAAGDGFGAAPKPAEVAPIILAPAPHPRLSININATRATSFPRVPTPQALSSLFVRGRSTPGASQSLAGMSTRASRSQQQDEEPVAVAPVAAAVERGPPTPLPIIDLWTELSMDSRLMELAIVAAVRSEARATEFQLRDTVANITAHAAANPDSEHAALNLTMHEHALALLKQAQRSAAVTAAVASEESNDFSAPPTVFEQMNDPKARSPLAFELYSLMLKHRTPLSHSNSYVQLMSQLRAHATSPAGLAAPQTVKTLLTTLSAEMAHSRSTGGPLQHRWVRGDVGQFRSSEFHLHHLLSTGAAAEQDGGDSLFQAVDILREMHAESLPAPEVASVAALFSSVIQDAEQGFARSKLLQDLLCTVEDYAAIEPELSVEALLQRIADGDAAPAL